MAGAKLDSVKYTNMFKAYGAFWRRGFTEWAGTASRSEYWWTYLVNVLIGLAVFIVFLFLGIFAVNVGLEGVINFDIVVSSLRVYYLAALVPLISLTVRRLHDAGLSSWFMALWGAVVILSWVAEWVLRVSPVVNIMHVIIFCISVACIVLMVLPTKVEDNPYHQFNK